VNAFGLANSAFTDTTVLSTYNFYCDLAYGAIIGLIIAFVIELFITYKDNIYGNGIAFESPGESPSISFFKKLSNFQIFLLFLIIFMIFGLIFFKGTSKQIIFGDVSPIPHEQFTAVGNLIWSNFLVPLSENLGLSLLIGIVIIGIRLIAKKYSMSKGNYIALTYASVIAISGIYGFSVHLMHYSGQEQSLLVVLVFWIIMGTLTLITGSFLPAWMMHLNNNLFGDLSSLVTSKDLVFYLMIGVIIALISLYLWLYVFRKKKTKVNWIKK
jgi:hypothetical protein